VKLKIEWLVDDWDCETCGSDYAEGANVWIDGVLTLELTPIAHCYDGVNYPRTDVYKRILEHLGHTVEVIDVT